MPIQAGIYKLIPLQNLLLDLQNARFEPRSSQQEALIKISHDEPDKLANIAEDILDQGLNYSDIPIVTQEKDGMYTVVEGNRRLAALKILSSQQLMESLDLPIKYTKRLRELCEDAKGQLPTEIFCVVMTREDATYWIKLKHTGENKGVGTLGWDGIAAQRFRGNSPALQAIDLVGKSDYINQETKEKLEKISITNIARLLSTPEARDILGVEVTNQQIHLKAPEDETLARLAMIVTDIAHKQIRVTQLDTKEQRIKYAQDIVAKPLPKPYKSSSKDGTGDDSSSKKGESSKPIPPGRKYLIPRQCKLVIPHTRINKIYAELQRLDVEKFTNSCSVMFRVFVEMSLDEYAEKNGISLMIPIKAKGNIVQPIKEKEMSLRVKLKTIANYLESQKICSTDQLRGIRTLINNKEHVLSVDNLNAYVHNRDYSPVPSDLKGNWDSIQAFIQKLWTE